MPGPERERAFYLQLMIMTKGVHCRRDDSKARIGRLHLLSLMFLFSTLFAINAQATIVEIGAASGRNDALPLNGTAGALTINKPPGTLPGHALIASIAARPSQMTVTVPAGWVLMTSTQQSAGGISTAPGGMTLLTYYKIVGVSDPASYTWTFANPTLNQGGSAVGGLLAFSGIDTSASPIDAWSQNLTPSGLTHATTQINTMTINTMIVSSISYLSAGNFGTPSGIAGLSERLDISAPTVPNAIGTTLQMATVARAGTGPTGNTQAVASGNADTGIGHLMALRASAVDPSIVMSRSGPLVPGGAASYTITVTNNGYNPEPGPITVVNTLPAGLGFTSAGPGWSCGVSGQVVTCTINGPLAANTSAVPLVLNVSVAAGTSGTKTNSATVFGTGGDGNTFNNTATDSYSIEVDLNLTMARNTALNPGQNATYTLGVTNTGPLAEAGPITLTDTLPSGLSYSSFVGAGWASCSTAGQVVTCVRNGTLASGASTSITLTVAVAAGATGVKTNSATVAGTSTDYDSSNNSAADTYTIASDLSVTLTRGGPLVAGTNGTYIINVANAGPSAEPGPVTLSDTLPAGLTYVSGIGTGWACGAAGQVVTCTRAGSLAGGSSAATLTLTVAVAANASGAISNSVTVSGAAGLDSNLANNTATDVFNFTPFAYYAMDETTWPVGNTVLDSSGNGRHATKLGTSAPTGYPVPGAPGGPGSALVGNPGTCGAGSIPAGGTQGVNTNIDVNSIGNAGTIAFWYSSNTAWSDGNDRTLLDASADLGGGNADRHFYLVKNNNGALRFAIEDSADAESTATSANNSFAANTWHHIAVTWDLAIDRVIVYLDGAAVVTSTSNLNGTLGNGGALYLGAPTGGAIGGTPGDYTANSANGFIDEVRIYNAAVNASGIAAIRDLRHTCAPIVDHYELSVPANSITCLASPVTVTACADNSSPCVNPATTISGETAALTASGGTLAASPVSFSGGGTAATTLSFPGAADGTSVSVTLSGESTAATNPRKCCQGGVCVVANSCSTTFNTTGFIFSTSAGGGVATIPTQVAGTTSANYFLRAVRTSSTTQACEAALTGTTAIDFAYECNNPTTCYTANLLSLNGGTSTVIARNNNGGVASYTSVNMTFDANGNAPFAFNYGDVGLVTLHARKIAAGALLSTLTGSSNPFVVKPFGFVVSNIQQTGAPNTPNPGAANALGAKFVKAGEAFSATVTAVAQGGAATPNYGKEISAEGVRLSTALIAPVGGANPALGNLTSFGAFSNGAASGSTFNWGEVGIISLTPSVGDGSYLGVGDVVGTTTGNVGRFVPNHFELGATTLTNRSAAGCVPPSSFTYMSEALQLGFTLTAKNAASGTTQNYDSANGFAKLDGTVPGNFGFGAINIPGTPLTSRLDTPSSSGSWASGIGIFTASVGILRAAAPDGPYNAVNFGTAPSDSDGVVLNSFNLDADNNASNERGLIGSTAIRYGRMRMQNAYGSELLGLYIPAVAQYYSAGGYLTHSSDSCTQIAVPTSPAGLQYFALTAKNQLANPETSATMGGVAAPGNGTLANGNARLRLSPPGSGNFGFLDVVLSVPSYLQFDWNGDGSYTDNPKSRARFGLFKNPAEFIYLREAY